MSDTPGSAPISEPGSADAIEGYAAAAAELIPAYSALPLSELVISAARTRLSEATGARKVSALDVGAGVGRDAAFVADLGYETTAVEPVAAFRTAGQTRAGVRWMDDRLPDLPDLVAAGHRFDFILANALWHHLTPAERDTASARLRTLCAPGGMMILSLRSGPYPPTRPGWPTFPDLERGRLAGAGWRVESSVDKPSIQTANHAAGVAWTWLTLRRAPDAERLAETDLPSESLR